VARPATQAQARKPHCSRPTLQIQQQLTEWTSPTFINQSIIDHVRTNYPTLFAHTMADKVRQPLRTRSVRHRR